MYKHEPRPDKAFHAAFKLFTPHHTMFKGILPPRRVPTPEFTIVSPLVENGKVAAAAKSGKAAAAAQDKPKRRKGGDVPPHTAPIANSTDREFDRLLVRAIAAVPPVSDAFCSRVGFSVG